MPKLPYDYAALEPIVCREIMELHHTKHHQTYVNNLNAAEEQLAEAQSKNDVTKIISLAPALRFNGGGHINHSIFWQNLTSERTEPSADLKKAIESQWKSLDAFKKEMTALTVAVQGSGWGWLGYNKKTQKLQIVAMPNQDPLEASTGEYKSDVQTIEIRCNEFICSSQKVWYHCLVLMSGNMPTICNTKTYAPLMWKLYGTLPTGMISPNVSPTPSKKQRRRCFRIKHCQYHLKPVIG